MAKARSWAETARAVYPDATAAADAEERARVAEAERDALREAAGFACVALSMRHGSKGSDWRAGYEDVRKNYDGALALAWLRLKAALEPEDTELVEAARRAGGGK